MTILTIEEVVDSSVNDTKKIESIEQAYQKKSLWKVIAKNEIRTRTSNFRNHRKLLFIALYSLLSFSLFIVIIFVIIRILISPR